MEIVIEYLYNENFSNGFNDITNIVIKECICLEGFSTEFEVNVYFVDDDYIQEINNNQRGINKATDVLSFPMLDILEGKINSTCGDIDLDSNLLILGDIIISVDTAKRQSVEYGHSLKREIAFLIIHGMLHLLGYDHIEENCEKLMIKKQKAILERCKNVLNND